MAHFTSTICTAAPAADCADVDYRLTHIGECPDDTRCSDPVFAAANPGLCLNSPRLIIKPSAAVVEVLGEAQYRAFLWIGGEETALDDGVVWSVSDASIAIIGAGSGNATGTAVGIANVTATYGSLTATARIEVVADCGVRANHYLFLMDVSRSSGAEVTPIYGTRLAVAKSMANAFISNTDFARDDAAIMSFDTVTAAVQAFTTDAPVLTGAASGLSTTAANTDLETALSDADAYFTSQGVSATGRVIVLFTDGENNTGVSPLTIAESIKAAGTILIIVGLRAKGKQFSLLENMASGGFFINVLPSNIESVDGWLNGLRQYLCSGNCVPSGDVTVGVGALNFTGFTNWDVLSGHVDLIGQNTGGTPLYDFLPGNGLYVDGCGSAPPGGGLPDSGTIRTKNLIPVEEDHEYEFRISIAGNQREDRTPDVTRITVYDQSGNLKGTQDFSVTDYTQGFEDYSFQFDVESGSGMTGVRLQVEQFSVPAGSTDVFGSLWDNVRWVDVTGGAETVVFQDDFDDDNATYINPACGYGYSYGGYGVCYGIGCLEDSIPAQVPDPDPLLNREGEKNAAP